MKQEKPTLKCKLYICLLAVLCLSGLAIWPLAGGAFNSRSLLAGWLVLQAVLLLPLVYCTRTALKKGWRSLVSGVPAMEGLAIAALPAALIAGIYAGFDALSVSGVLFLPLALMLLFIFICGCLETGEAILQKGTDACPEKKAAFWLPFVFAAALAAGLSCWFYGLGAAAAWQVLGSVLLAGGAGVFMLSGRLPEFFAVKTAAYKGIAFKDYCSIRRSSEITMAVFDEKDIKTGTQELTDIITAAASEAQLLGLCSSAMQSAGHPLAELMQKQAEGLQLPVCSGVVKLRGGIAAQCGGKNIRIGSLAFVSPVAAVPQEYRNCGEELQKQGKEVFYITSGRSLQGLIAIGTALNSGIAEALLHLQKLGVRTVLFSSGNKYGAEYTAKTAGFGKAVAALTEEQKTELAQTFCRGGEFVAVVKPQADDTNTLDAAFYNRMGTQTGGLLLQHGKAENLAEAIKLSAELLLIQKQNLRITAWLGALWMLAAACGWQLLFGSVIPGAVLGLMLTASGLAVWLNSRRLRK